MLWNTDCGSKFCGWYNQTSEKWVFLKKDNCGLSYFDSSSTPGKITRIGQKKLNLTICFHLCNYYFFLNKLCSCFLTISSGFSDNDMLVCISVFSHVCPQTSYHSEPLQPGFRWQIEKLRTVTACKTCSFLKIILSLCISQLSKI